MADFKKALSKVLKWEGGWYNGSFKGDPNPTNKGITLKTYQYYYGKDKTREDLKAISMEEVETIYRKLFWEKIQGDSITNQSIAELWFDTCVNMGVSRGIKSMQRLLKVDVDGTVGRKTISALNGHQNKRELFTHYWKWREDHYRGLAEKNASMRIFLKGWLNRLNDYQYEV